jgi:hypothetical protein
MGSQNFKFSFYFKIKKIQGIRKDPARKITRTIKKKRKPRHASKGTGHPRKEKGRRREDRPGTTTTLAEIVEDAAKRMTI